ncbi:DUF6233 domain-containing protein [Streptomyces sp. NPDC005408]|uniref:DUF6233 domain-containing protein n=1 Tax=Streptomyces sp. NPDC005408 TaxID=3155341 RepID=UPI0033AF550B
MTAPPPPPVWVKLPDGQELRGRLHARLQTTRAWMYKVGLPMWQGTAKEWVEPAEYVVWVPADYVRPIEGADYDSVPTQRLQSDAPPTDTRWAWTVQRLQGPDGRVRGTVVHSYDCENSPRGATELNLDEALTALRRPGASACKECDAAAALTPLV